MNMWVMRCFLFLTVCFALFSCEEEKQGMVNPKQKEQPKEEWKPKFYGKQDLPEDDSTITSVGIGRILLGQQLEKVDGSYDSIQSFNLNADYLEWPAKKVILDKKEWLIASTTNSVGRINMLRTNSRTFHTKNGIRVGMKLADLRGTDTLLIDRDEKAFILYPGSIEFRIEESFEKQFFRSKNPDIHKISPKAVIREIFIQCGDC